MLVQNTYNMAILFKTAATSGRTMSAPEIESQIIGPQLAFVESMEQNLQTITRLLPDLNLMLENVQVGHYTKTDIALLYVKNIAQPENVHALLRRLQNLKIDGLYDASMLLQHINDNTYLHHISTNDRYRASGPGCIKFNGR